MGVVTVLVVVVVGGRGILFLMRMLSGKSKERRED
jgi:hypothetical protein